MKIENDGRLNEFSKKMRETTIELKRDKTTERWACV